jgi:uncharacterized membrane protein
VRPDIDPTWSAPVKAAILPLTLSFLIMAITPAYAYLDPATGSMLLQGLIGGVAASITIVSLYYHRAVAFFQTKFGKKNKSETSAHDPR